MAMEVCSENCCGVSSSISPRISFSHDFSQSDFIPVEQQQHPFGSDPSSDDNLNQNTDFDFCVTESFDLESLPAADEFFSDGRILPTEVKTSKNNNTNSLLKPKGQLFLAPHPPPPPLPPPCVVNNHHHHYNGSSSASSSKFKSLKKDHSYKEGKYFNNDEVCDKQQQNSGSSKSFWSFKRSSSCGNGYRRSLCPLPLLSRSNSTGSTSPEVNKRSSLSKEGHNHNNNKQNSSQKHSSSSSSFTRCSSPSVGPNIYQKPPLNYSKNGSYGNSVRVSPVLNVHSANLFGLGSIFSNNNRDKSNKKK